VPTNQIRAVTFRPVAPDPDGENEGGHALSLSLDIPEPARLLGFLEEVVHRFKAEHMEGPPDTRFLLITVAGDVAAEEFAQLWRTAIANELPARALVGTLHRADVVQGDEGGRTLGQASLLAPEVEIPLAER
jgi:hypothetical protein